MRRALTGLTVLGLTLTGAFVLDSPTAATSAPLAAATAHGGGSHAVRAKAPSYGTVRNILPPGSIGNVTAADLVELGLGNAGGGLGDPTSLLGNLANAQAFLATATPTTPKYFADQLEQYDALNAVDPSKLTDAQLPRYFKDASLGVEPGQVDHVEHPRPGTTIVWDKDGVPHITGRTDEDLAYGAGVALMESRMFLTDVLRHTGAANMAQFVGPTDADIAQDAAQLAIAPYRPFELDKQISSLVHRSPVAARLVHAIDAYVAGINDEQTRLCPLTTAAIPLPADLGLGFGVDCPVEYAALQRPPAPYTRGDVVAIASLVGGIFGTGGGGQYTNSIWLQQLREKFGKVRGTQMYDDLREKNDPEAPVTTTLRFPYGGRDHVRPNLPGVAMPDLHPQHMALGTGAIVNQDGSLSAPPSGAAGNQGNASTGNPHPTPARSAGSILSPVLSALAPVAEAHQIQGSLQRALNGELVGMSNELIVDGAHSTSGHPTAVFGPQTGYYAPQLLMEEELHGPHTWARGVSFAGTNFVVELGHGPDYAWSATSPYTDITDTVVQHLCNTNGSRATVTSTAYIDERGKCRKMIQYHHVETGFPTLAGAAAPQQITLLVLRTDQGIVKLRTTVKGKPVAISLKRSTYMHEPDSVLGFLGLNDPRKVRNANGFMHAVARIRFAFNWFYVDDKDIAYYSSALLPKRAKGTDLDLPRWGTKKYSWRGYESFAAHPHEVNPTRGYIANWNNKLATGFASSSQVYGDGSVYRSLTLSDRIQALIKGGHRVTRASLVGAMIDAGTVDLRGAYVLPYALRVLGNPKSRQDAAAVRVLKSWVNSGAHREDRDRSGTYSHQAAIALFDTWWDPDDIDASCSPHCGFSLPKDALRHGLKNYVNVLPEPLDDHPREGIGSAFNGISWYGYLNKTLRSALGLAVRGAYSTAYCGTLPQCRATLRRIVPPGRPRCAEDPGRRLGRAAYLRQVPRRHQVRGRRSRRRTTDRLAEPPDLPAGGDLLPAPMTRQLGSATCDRWTAGAAGADWVRRATRSRSSCTEGWEST